MKIAGKIICVLWSLLVLAVVCCYLITAVVGMQVKEIVTSSIESMGLDYMEYEDKIDEPSYGLLWHQRFDMISYDRIQIEEQGLTQEYTITTPQILFFSSNKGTFTFNKVAYIYDVHIYNGMGEEAKTIAPENVLVALDVEYEDGGIKIVDVYYDTFDTYKISPFYLLPLVVVLLINAIARNIRYFDHCIIKERKKHLFFFIQPYIFAVLMIVSMFVDIFTYALFIGIIQEIILSIVFFVYKKFKLSVQMV